MLPLKLQDLCEHLTKSHKPDMEEKHDQIGLVIKAAGEEIPVFVGILHERIVQMIAYLPFEIKEGNLDEVARFLHQLNKDLDLPGFGMDESSGLIFYRAVIPCLKPEVDEELFDAYLKTLKTACGSVLEAIKEGQSGSPVSEAARASHVAGKSGLKHKRRS